MAIPPNLAPDYLLWRNSHRLNTVACAAFVAKQFCDLEERSFDDSLRKRAYFAIACATLTDDIIDSGDGSSLDIFGIGLNGDTLPCRLLRVFAPELESRLPPDFRYRFSNIVHQYNAAQQDSKKLFDPLPRGELCRLKDEIGGYSALLFHRMLFPHEQDIPEFLHVRYGKKPMFKNDVIAGFGAMVSRIDDLEDAVSDAKEGRANLTNAKLISWSMVGTEIEKTRSYLKEFYSPSAVDRVMDVYSARILHILSAIARWSQFL